MHVFFYRLLDVLAGRKDPAGLRGTLLLDGSPPPEKSFMSSYQLILYELFINGKNEADLYRQGFAI
jgi:hypothetical protein